jgi:hypothetical protein
LTKQFNAVGHLAIPGGEPLAQCVYLKNHCLAMCGFGIKQLPLFKKPLNTIQAAQARFGFQACVQLIGNGYRSAHIASGIHHYNQGILQAASGGQ